MNKIKKRLICNAIKKIRDEDQYRDQDNKDNINKLIYLYKHKREKSIRNIYNYITNTLNIDVLLKSKYNKNIIINISVDWEGKYIDYFSIREIKRFKKKYPDVCLTHYICPHYFLEENNQKNINYINDVITENDEIALHVHCWRQIVINSGVEYNSSPSFYDNYFNDKYGHSVLLSSYNKDEIHKIMKYSKKLLEETLKINVTSFRAGGWIASINVLISLINLGIYRDASHPSYELIKKHNKTGYNVLKDIWKESNVCLQPYNINLENGTIKEYPNNGLFVDYLTSNEMIKIFWKNISEWNGEKDLFISFAFHQEGAKKYISRINKLVSKLKRYENKYDFNIVYENINKINIL